MFRLFERRHHNYIVFELTQRCNHDCLHCYNAWKNERPYPSTGELGTADILRMMDRILKQTRARLVTLSGGEPLLRPDIVEIVELALALGVDGVMFNRFNPGGRGARNIEELQATPEDIYAALEVAEAAAVLYGLRFSCGIALPPCLIDTKPFSHLSFGYCAAGTSRAYYTIDPMGNLRPCNHSTTILGNVRQKRFWRLVDSPAMKDFMAAHPAFCAGCGMELECLGGCKAAADVCFGAVDAMDPFLAAYSSQAVSVPLQEPEG